MSAERRLEILDLAGHSGTGSGAVLSRETEDLDVNLVRFENGAGVGAHVNREVDVLVVVVAGRGILEAGGAVHELRPGQAALIPKGLERSIRSAEQTDFVYLTVHQRRRRLMPQPRPRPIA